VLTRPLVLLGFGGETLDVEDLFGKLFGGLRPGLGIEPFFGLLSTEDSRFEAF
jgi:hypothetical protein